MEQAGLLSTPFLASAPIFPTGKNFTRTTTTVKPVLNPSSIKNTSTNTATTDHDEKKKLAVEEIRVCTNRTCRRQGSLDILQILSGISPPCLSINSCGCLGRCGAGPNVVVLPQELFVGHCGTSSKAAHLVISLVCAGDGDEEVERKCRKCLEALALRKRAEDEMGKGKFDEALLLLAQVLYCQNAEFCFIFLFYSTFCYYLR